MEEVAVCVGQRWVGVGWLGGECGEGVASGLVGKELGEELDLW